ncbi:MAG: RNA pseudouridine synthase, partial [Corynebacterium flavescens]|nr:RNA pseudouridine synthase [Corynebacterium flavescens]
MSNRQTRTFLVPEGLDGMRADAALAKLLGLSRSVTAQLCADGDVVIDSAAVSKSDRLQSATMVEVTLPQPDAPLVPKEELVEGMDVLYADEDIICVQKPVGVVAHPTLGWEGP